jgi:hypothetical protein
MPARPALFGVVFSILVPATIAASEPSSTRAAPAVTPAAQAPVRIDRRLALEAVRDQWDEAEVLAPDDDPKSLLYEPRGAPARTRAPRAPGGATPAAAYNYGANVRLSTTLEPAGIGESEVSLAAVGDRLVAGWNDGLVFGLQPGFVGFAYSTNGGASWTDGGSLPVAGATDIYYGDPVVAADPAGHWYFADLYRATPGETGISVNHATFAGASPVWDLPKVIATSVSDLLDKPWLAVDAQDGTAYVAFVRFFAGGQRIEFARSLDHGTTWSVPVVMTDAAATAVMSPRLVVGPDHELYLVYYSHRISDGNVYLQLRSSANHGQNWGPERTVAGRPFFNNAYSGPAGFNRERFVALVSADVDRTAGLTRGQLHVVWNEMQDIYADGMGGGGAVAEVEGNDNSATATPFTLGAELTGALASGSDQDWWSFSGNAGQTVLFQLEPVGSPCNGFLRMFAGGGAAANRCAFSHFGGGVGVIVFTLPSTGTYYVRVLSWDGNGTNLGAYHVLTGLHVPVPTDLARDHRDVVYTSSPDGGVHWTTPLVLSDAPPRFDETFPEVAVDASGAAYVMWYDHREDPANGILTTMRVRETVNAGATWIPSARIDDGPPVNWSLVSSNMFPNMGDYSQVVADGGSVHAIWADGRDGSPDPYYARLVNPSVGVAPEPRALALRVRGIGTGAGGSVRALVTAPGSGEAHLELFDVTGRRLAELAIAGGSPREVDLGRGLPSGIYLLRASQQGLSASARVLALR